MNARGLLPQIARYVAGAATSAILSFCLPLILHKVVGLEARLAVACGLTVATAVNFLIARFLVFGGGIELRKSVPRYIVTVIGFRVVEYAFFVLLFDVALLPYVVALGLPLIVSTILKFVIYRLVVFGRVST